MAKIWVLECDVHIFLLFLCGVKYQNVFVAIGSCGVLVENHWVATVKSIYAHFTALKRLSAAGKLLLLPRARWVTNAIRTCSLMHPTLNYNMKYVTIFSFL